jgi:hypothetical protein
MDRSGCPSNLWFYAMCYVIFCLNHTVDLNLCDGTKTPYTLASGLVSDISPLLAFYFYQPVYFHLDSADQTHPHSTERRGRWLGISEHIGHDMTFLIITDDTQEIISRSILRPADDPSMLNLREDPLTISPTPTPSPIDVALRPSLAGLDRSQSDRTTPSFVYFRDDGEHIDSDGPTEPPWTQFEITLKDENGKPRLDSKGDPITVIAPPPSDLQGRVFLTKPDEHGDIKRARVVELMNMHDASLEKNKDLIKFKIRYDRDDLEDIMSYNEILDYIEREHNSEDGPLWQFRRLLAHQHTPLGHPDRNGSDYNVKVEWETGEITQEPLAILTKDIPVDLAKYAKENDLLDQPGWKQF